MQLEQNEGPEGLTIVVNGDVDMEQSPKLRDAIKKGLKSKRRSFGFDSATCPTSTAPESRCSSKA